ncbi:hypothetical protein CEE37_05280 [candidate division LCP-89 bacterium B3_LCP]|uniref:Uncharacterized protein n=1 Tax=candidate division LCP-89 bacterium B3_LCP TaxID=2012998 RepID=A0A532V1J0_UNCL8|nr:MAG: hypothetical protein CEE37_05280 [candidate division LCP-89 bacterium B3_LCP]
MLSYEIAIVIIALFSLVALVFIKSKLLKAVIIALTSVVLLLLYGMFSSLIEQQVGLLASLSTSTHMQSGESMMTPDMLAYATSIIEKLTEYGHKLKITRLMLLGFLIVAPFTQLINRKQSQDLK